MTTPVRPRRVTQIKKDIDNLEKAVTRLEKAFVQLEARVDILAAKKRSEAREERLTTRRDDTEIRDLQKKFEKLFGKLSESKESVEVLDP